MLIIILLIHSMEGNYTCAVDPFFKSKGPEFAMRPHVVLTVLKDCEVSKRDDDAWWFHPWEQPALTLHRLPPPPEEGYRQALEACKLSELKQANGVGDDGDKGDEVRREKEEDGRACNDGQKEGLREYVKKLPNYKEVIKELVKFAATMDMKKFALFRQGVSEVSLLRFSLTHLLDACLELPLRHQGMSIMVGEDLKPEDSSGDLRATVFAERTGKPIWGLTIEAKSVPVNTMEKAAAVMVAKALSLRGEMGLEQLDIADKQKSIVREFLDKDEQKEVVVVEMEGLKKKFEGKEGGAHSVGQVDVDGEIGEKLG